MSWVGRWLQRQKRALNLLEMPLYYKTESHTEPEAYHWTRLAGHRVLRILPQHCGLSGIVPSVYKGTGDPNSSLHACTNILPTKPSPWTPRKRCFPHEFKCPSCNPTKERSLTKTPSPQMSDDTNKAKIEIVRNKALFSCPEAAFKRRWTKTSKCRREHEPSLLCPQPAVSGSFSEGGIKGSVLQTMPHLYLTSLYFPARCPRSNQT